MARGGPVALAILLALAQVREGEAMEHYSYDTAEGGIRYSLVAITNGGGSANPSRNLSANTSDPAVGEYVLPLYGNFSYLRFECGYKLEGVQGYIELFGSWAWEPGGYLESLKPAAKLRDNTKEDPKLPGWPGDSVYSWNNFVSSSHMANIGVTGFQEVDNATVINEYIFACFPGYSWSSHNKWISSSYAGDTKYVRLWLGQEVPGAHYSDSWDQVTWYLVGISNGGNGVLAGPDRNWAANTSSQWLGEYVRPKYGTFTHLQYDCGYGGEGPTGYIQLIGSWEWLMPTWSGLKTYLSSLEVASRLRGNSVKDPKLPGYSGYGGYSWMSYTDGGATFGINGFSEVNTQGVYGTYIFACNPSANTSGGSYTTWEPSATKSTLRYVRLWLGIEDVPSTSTSTTFSTSTLTTTTSTSTTNMTMTTTTTMTASTTYTTLMGIASTALPTTTTTTVSTTPPGQGDHSIGEHSGQAASTTSSNAATTTAPTTTASTTTTTTATTTASTTTASTTTTTATTTASTTTASTMTTTTATQTGTTTTTVTGTTTSTTIQTWLVQAEEAGLLAELRRGGNTSLLQEGGASLVLQRLGADQMSGNGSVEVTLPGTEVDIVLPSALLQTVNLRDVALAVAVFDSTVAVSTGGNTSVRTGSTVDFEGSGSEVTSIVSVSLWEVSTGSVITVDQLSVPILVAFPVNRSAGLACAYWDEAGLAWSARGLTDTGEEGGRLVCATTHLTLFAAILRGIESTLMCSQALLLTGEGIRALMESDWQFSIGAIMLWALLALFVLMFLSSMVLDCWRVRNGGWTDEHFLIPMQEGEVAGKKDKEEEEEEEPEPRGCLMALLCCLASFVACPFRWCYESSAVRDALDDVLSNWIDNFAEIRDFVEGLCEGLALGENSEMEGFEGGRCMRVLSWVVASLVVTTARRQASISMRMSHEVLQFVTEDEDLKDYLHPATDSTSAQPSEKLQTAGGDSSPQKISKPDPAEVPMEPLPQVPRFTQDVMATSRHRSSPSSMAGSMGKTKSMASASSLAREQAWRELHQTAIACVDKRFEQSANWCSLPFTVGKLFLAQVPFVSTLMSNILWSSTLRTLFFMTDIFGALAMGTLFFQASGSVTSKKSRGNCASNDPREQIGRLLVIGVASLFVAGIPSAVLSSLHSRSFKRFEYEGCPAWRRQLRIWRIQDTLLWILGLSYLSFCIFFILVFLANVEQKDHPNWVVSGSISFVEDTLVLPISIAICVPLLATTCLSLLSCCKRAKKIDLLRQRRVDLDRRGNWQVEYIARV